MPRPLWKCPRCERQFANRNQAHSCTDVTVHDCLKGKSEPVVELYHAFAAAVRACGEVRVHPTPSRIAFITRMTFAGAALKRDHIEAGMMLPYRSQSPRFHRFLPNRAGGVHWLRLTQAAEIDEEVRGWIAEAYRCGLQTPDAPKLAKRVATAPLPPPLKRRGGRRIAGKIFYLHWNEGELEQRSRPLRKAGHDVLGHWSTQVPGKLGDFVPDVVVISLDRLPSHGRAYAGWIWEAKKRQSIPIVFSGGQPDKVLVTKHQFPRGIFCRSDEVPQVVERLIQAK
jgi:hypothetical protein